MTKCISCGSPDGRPRPDTPAAVCDRCWQEHLWRNEAQVAVGLGYQEQIRRAG